MTSAVIGALTAIAVMIVLWPGDAAHAQQKPGCLILEGGRGGRLLVDQINDRFAEGYEVKGFAWLNNPSAGNFIPFAVVCRK